MYYNMFKFQVKLITIFLVIVYTDTPSDKQTGRNEYCIAAVDKPQLYLSELPHNGQLCMWC